MIQRFSQFQQFIHQPVNLIGLIGLMLTLPVLAMFAIKGFFVRYVADDFCTAGSLIGRDWWSAQLHWYNSWSGRFGFTAIITFLEKLGEWTVQILPLLTIFGWLIILSWTIRLTLMRVGISVNYIVSGLLSSLIIFAYIVTNPHTGQTFYWFTGNVTYTLPLVMLSLAIGLAIKLLNDREQAALNVGEYIRTKQSLLTIATSAIFFIAPSLNETYAVFQLALLGIVLCVMLLKQLQSTSAVYINIALVGLWVILTLFAIAIMYLAPGNSIRNAAFPDNPTISQTMEYALNATNTYLINDWPYALFLYIFVIAACIFAWQMQANRKSVKRASLEVVVYQSIAVLSIAYMLCVLVQAPSYYVQHYPTSARSLTSIPFTLAAVAIFMGYQIARVVNELKFINYSALRPLLALILFLTGVQFFTSQTVYLVDETINQLPELQHYAHAWDSQSLRLVDLGQSQAVAATVRKLGYTFELEDVSTDKSHWINQCMADYYSIEFIKAE